MARNPLQQRIRRDAGLPKSIAYVEPEARQYRHRGVFVDGDVTYKAMYQRRRKYRIPEGHDLIWKREVFGWIKVGRKIAGAIRFAEFDVEPFVDRDEFLEAMDVDAQEDSTLATVLSDVWDWPSEDVAAYGPIVELRLVWMSPEFSKTSAWAKVVNWMLETEFANYSILVLKAFPLEYENQVPRGSPLAKGLSKRQAAMKRHYRRHLGVQPFPGKHGRDGWLWRPHDRLIDIIDIEPPVRRRDRRSSGYAD